VVSRIQVLVVLFLLVQLAQLLAALFLLLLVPGLPVLAGFWLQRQELATVFLMSVAQFLSPAVLRSLLLVGRRLYLAALVLRVLAELPPLLVGAVTVVISPAAWLLLPAVPLLPELEELHLSQAACLQLLSVAPHPSRAHLLWLVALPL
jgi:hypothetical protein